MVHPYREQAKASTAARIKRAGGNSSDAVVNHPHAKKARLKLAAGGAALEGAGSKKRLDKSRGNTVNIIIADKPDAPPAAPMPPKPPMPMPMAAKPPMPMPAPGAPPGAPPTGLPPQLAAAALAARANGQPPMKRGGSINMTAGADSGEGRLQEAKAARAGGFK